MIGFPTSRNALLKDLVSKIPLLQDVFFLTVNFL
jgi:hypothetical protein